MFMTQDTTINAMTLSLSETERLWSDRNDDEKVCIAVIARPHELGGHSDMRMWMEELREENAHISVGIAAKLY